MYNKQNVLKRNNCFLDDEAHTGMRSDEHSKNDGLLCEIFDKISCIRKIGANDLQSAGEASGLVPEQRRLGRSAHKDQFLIGQHHHAGEGGKPHSQMNESLVMINCYLLLLCCVSHTAI